jgi:hypothetical protein
MANEQRVQLRDAEVPRSGFREGAASLDETAVRENTA